MRIAIYADPHWCEYSSIVRKQGSNHSVRLENLIKSLSWAESVALGKQCHKIVCLGDFFDRSDLNANEISAMKEVVWHPEIGHLFIVGNHEMGSSDLSSNSANLFSFMDMVDIVDKPFVDEYQNVELAFIPYVLEENRKKISGYLHKEKTHRRILFMHNDIKGIQMGKFISKSGFDINDIENNCDLCFNGHLHNGGKISDKIINVGNITGQNFSEDADKYSHGLYILDTDSLEYEFIENPHAFNFYKLDLTDNSSARFNLKQNAVVTLRCYQHQLQEAKDFLNQHPTIVESRFIIVPESSSVDSIIDIESFSIDHIKQFKEYITDTMENTDILMQELLEVCK